MSTSCLLNYYYTGQFGLAQDVLRLKILTFACLLSFFKQLNTLAGVDRFFFRGKAFIAGWQARQQRPILYKNHLFKDYTMLMNNYKKQIASFHSQ